MEIRRRPTPAPRPSLLTVKTKRPPPPVPQKPPGLHHRVKMIRAMNFGVAAEEEDSCAEDEEAAGEQGATTVHLPRPFRSNCHSQPSAPADDSAKQKPKNPAAMMERCVPVEYSSSPIVEILTDSANHKHPRPPNMSVFPTRNDPSSATSEKEKKRRSGVVKAKAAVVVPQTAAVTLLDQIVLTHPIWYLQNIGRAQATHLLRPMHQGAFIVRASSRSNSMALSIRLPEGYGIDTDHYLIEHCPGSTRAVRLESSPNSFKSLPHLIEHYCQHGEELQTKLVLPEAIAACTTTPALQSIALMGQDFWTSEVSQHHARNGQKPVPMQRSRVAQPERVPISLKKSLSSQDGFHRGGSGTVSSASSSSTSSSSKKGASFLKSLFSGSGNDLDKVKSKSPIPIHGLAHCEYFTPCSQNGITSSQSAFTVSGNHRDSFSKVPSSTSLYSGSIRSSNSRNSLKTFKPTAESHDNVNAMNLHGSGTGSWKKSFPFGKGIALRRERSDLCASSVDRLAYHHHGSTSPGPQLRRKDRAGSASSGNSSPLVPPVGKQFMDKTAINSCIEELRKKRFTSNERSSPDCASGKISISSDSGPYVASLRRKHDHSGNGFSRLQDQEHRLSVPNLADAMDFSDPHHRNAANAGRALRAKLGRVPGTGELQTINEGLITPVVRRKQFSIDISAKPVVTSAPSPSLSTGSSSTSSSQQSPPAKVAAAAGGWSAVASEIKTRQQKVAKVRPTPSRMVLPPVKSVSGSRLVPHQSEYAQLSEFSDVSVKSVASAIDDDNVSVAGTVFNEPWDSNVWENLLDLAQYGDEKPTSSPSANLRPTLSATTTDTIHEEEGTELEDEDDDVEVMCASVGSDTETEEETTKMEEGSSSPNENRDVYGSLYRSRKSMNENETNSNRRATILRIGSKCWNEMSQRIPSEPASKNSTYDRKSRASTCDDVSLNSLTRRRTLTPNNSDWILTESTVTLMDNQSGDNSKAKAPTLSPIMSPPRLRNTVDNSDPGIRIQTYVEKLAQDSRTVFGATLNRFIECTLESVECDPQVVIRNVRQFLNGIKNYLVKHGEADLHSLIERESANLNSNEFLNIDAILEAVLHKILLVPVKAHLYHLMVREYSKNGSLQSLSENLQFVRTRTPQQLGFACSTLMPSSQKMDAIKMCLRKMQHHYSPLKKLDNLLKALSVAMEDSLKLHDNDGLPPADELVRWLVYILARTSTVGCEVEAWYMWELLPQQLLTSGDVSYYLTTLFSAIHVLKNVDCIKRLANPADDRFIISESDNEKGPSMGGSDGLVKVAVPNESEGTIKYHTFPAVPQMTAAKLCRVIAHRFAVTNPEDYGLYILFDGFETCLLGTEFPDTIREQLRKAKKPHLFAYKRHEAKIAWPKFPQPTTPVKT